MKKKIYVLVTFTTYNYEFTSSVHATIEDARLAQMKWLAETCKLFGIETPTKDELMNGESDEFFYNEDTEYLCSYGTCYENYSTIEIHDIEI